MGFFNFFDAKPSPEKFAKIFIDQARKQGFNKPMKFEPDDFRIVMPNGQICNLTNVYRDYCNVTKAERINVLTKYAASLNILEVPSTFEEVKSHLMPTIRGRGQGEFLRLSNHLSKGRVDNVDSGHSTPLSDDAVVMLAYDTEHSIMLVGQSELNTWGVSLDYALEVALSNLRDHTVDKFGDLGDGVKLGQWNDAYDTSRMLLSDVVFRSNVGNDPVMMIPTRASFLLTSASNPVGLAKMVDLAHETVEKDGRPISALMYKIRDGKAVQYLPDDSDILRKLNDLKKRGLAEDYASQKNLLDKIHQAAGKDIFVATYKMLQGKKHDDIVTLCSWTKGVDTLLPQTDYVAMVTPSLDAGREHAVKIITWDAALDIGGKFMFEADGYPVRYRVTEFPSVDQMDLVSAAEF